MAKQNVTLWIDKEVMDDFRSLVPTKQTSEVIAGFITDYTALHHSKDRVVELVKAHLPDDGDHDVHLWYTNLVEQVKADG